MRWWSPWNEPNHPAFISPQRAPARRPRRRWRPRVYAAARARAPRPRWTPRPATSSSSSARWPARPSPSPRRSTVQEMVAALPDDVACASRTWSQHDYAQVTPDPGKPDPVTALEQALDARPCTRGAHVWVTETGVGGDDPGAHRGRSTIALSCARHVAAPHADRAATGWRRTIRGARRGRSPRRPPSRDGHAPTPPAVARARRPRLTPASYPTYDLVQGPAAGGARAAPSDPPRRGLPLRSVASVAPAKDSRVPEATTLLGTSR